MSALPSHAITLFPEWLLAICFLGKDVENRSWKPPSWLIGQRIALHAGLSFGGRGAGWAAQWSALADVADMARGAGLSAEVRRSFTNRNDPPFLYARPRGGGSLFFSSASKASVRPIHTGAIVATARLAGVTQNHPSAWSVSGQYQWLLEDVQLLDEPIPCRGGQRLWRTARVTEALEAASAATQPTTESVP